MELLCPAAGGWVAGPGVALWAAGEGRAKMAPRGFCPLPHRTSSCLPPPRSLALKGPPQQTPGP